MRTIPIAAFTLAAMFLSTARQRVEKGGSRNRLLAARAAGATRRYMHSQMLKGA